MLETGRQQEARIVAKANRVEAVIRLCTGKVDTWEAFLHETDPADVARLDRNRLRQQAATAKQRVRKLVVGFSRFFFAGATEGVFEALFQEIKSGIPLGLRMPMSDFEARFAPVRRETSKGRDQERPFHATISITLLGLRYQYPEWHFANDIVMATAEARELSQALARFSGAFDPTLKKDWVQSQDVARRQAAVCRWGIVACSSLVEAHLAALAWRLQKLESERVSQLSSKDRRTVEDAGPTFRDRLVRIPRILTGIELWDEQDADVQAIMQTKHIRDALMHPSPWSVPEKYGGRDKLAIVYDLDHDELEKGVKATFRTLKRIFQHMHGCSVPLPSWLLAVGALVDDGPTHTGGGSAG